MLKKPYSKKEAYAAAAALLSKQGEGVDLDRLLLYFAPPKPRKCSTPEEWVARAAAVKDVREYLRYLYVAADGWAVATDGARMHWARTTWAPGWYDPRTLKRVEEPQGRYVDWQRVIPPAHSVQAAEGEWAIVPAGAHVAVRLPSGMAVMQHYFLDAEPSGEIGVFGGGITGNSQWGQFVIIRVRL